MIVTCRAVSGRSFGWPWPFTDSVRVESIPLITFSFSDIFIFLFAATELPEPASPSVVLEFDFQLIGFGPVVVSDLIGPAFGLSWLFVCSFSCRVRAWFVLRLSLPLVDYRTVGLCKVDNG